MRKFVLIAAMALVSATAQAGQSRSLTMVSAEPPAASTQPTAAKAQTAQTTDAATPPAASTETPKFVERPAAVDPTTTPAQPKTDIKADTKADGAKPVRQTANKADRPRHRTHWTEARIIGELHRHGIYW
jgi:cytoskeletal protein RodZ